LVFNVYFDTGKGVREFTSFRFQKKYCGAESRNIFSGI